MIKSILLILFYCSLSVAYHGTPVVWDRITQFKVNERVTSFLNKQGVNNCYEYEFCIFLFRFVACPTCCSDAEQSRP